MIKINKHKSKIHEYGDIMNTYSEDLELSFTELVHELEKHSLMISSNNFKFGDWVYEICDQNDFSYRTGGAIETSFHFCKKNKKRDFKYFFKALKYLRYF